MHRDVERALVVCRQMQEHVDSALLADSTRDMTTHGGAAQQIAVDLMATLRDAMDAGGASDTELSNTDEYDPTYVHAALASLNRAWTAGEKLGLGTDVRSLRVELIDFKTHADYATAYLRAALRSELV